jgi:hypothetical protein
MRRVECIANPIAAASRRCCESQPTEVVAGRTGCPDTLADPEENCTVPAASREIFCTRVGSRCRARSRISFARAASSGCSEKKIRPRVASMLSASRSPVTIHAPAVADEETRHSRRRGTDETGALRCPQTRGAAEQRRCFAKMNPSGAGLDNRLRLCPLWA